MIYGFLLLNFMGVKTVSLNWIIAIEKDGIPRICFTWKMLFVVQDFKECNLFQLIKDNSENYGFECILMMIQKFRSIFEFIKNLNDVNYFIVAFLLNSH